MNSLHYCTCTTASLESIKRDRKIKTFETYGNISHRHWVCSLRINKTRDKNKTLIWMSVWWKTKTYFLRCVVYYESIKGELKIRCIYECRCDERLQWRSDVFLFYFILLWIKKARAKDKTYIWGSVWWKTQKLKLRNLHVSHTLGCATPAVIHT